MPAMLVNNSPGTIHVSEMQDGDIAVIVSWEHDCIGRIVQRYGMNLVSIGRVHGAGWGGAFGTARITGERCRVRVLQPGELIEVTE